MKGKPGLKKRLLAMALCAVVGLTSAPFRGVQTVYGAETLKGVSETHWAREPLANMVRQGILSGDSEGNLHPDRPITKAEYIAMLNRAFNYTSYKDRKLPFTDMTGNEWYADHIRVAYSQGYFSGMSPTEAGATRAITREEAAAMLCRNLKVDNRTLQVTEFTDGRDVSQWSRGSVGAAVDKRYIHGYEDGTFRPKNNISRAEAATMLSNALGTIYTQSGTYGFGMIEGNVTISSSSVEMRDAVISGDLYLTEGVGTGYVNLNNVTVLGEVIVCGGGEGNLGGNSVLFDDCTVQKLTVDGPEVPLALYAKGDTIVASTNIKSNAFLQNHPDTYPGFSNVKVMGPEETKLSLSGGTFPSVEAINLGNDVHLGKGRVENLTVDEDALESTVTLDRGVVVENLNLDGESEVVGRGDIEVLNVTTNGCEVQSLPDVIEIRPSNTATIAGQEMTNLDGMEATSFPKISAGYPKADEVAPLTANMLFAANKPGVIHWALTYADADELKKDEILKPATITAIKNYGTLNVTESDMELTVALKRLESNAKYTLSAVLVDARGDVSRIKEETFKTADNTTPGFVKGYPKTEAKSSNSFEIKVMPTKDGTIYWAVFPKGAVTPTPYQMRSKEVEGAIVSGSRKSSERNVEYDLEAMSSKFKENQTYDVYVMLSDGENESKVVKVTGATKDTTPPKFVGLPRMDKNEEKAVNVAVAADENCTAYYVVTEWDDKFPIAVPPATTPPPLEDSNTEAKWAQKQVINGNNVFRAGKISLSADKEGIIKISGLGKETPYHVFITLVDSSGNIADEVKTVDVKTKDVNAPIAVVAFDDPIGGKAQVENEIRIEFNEIVCYQNIASYLSDAKPEHLEDVVKLEDVTREQKEEVVIDYTKIKFASGENGATHMIFPPDAFPAQVQGGEVGLNSGSRYQFTLNNIVDTSGNAMKKDTVLDMFETVPPLVVLTETASDRTMDYTFTVEPESRKTSEYILFDMLFQTDTTVRFELYEKVTVGSEQVWKQIWELDKYKKEDVDEPMLKTFTVNKGSSTSLQHIIDKNINGLDYYDFPQFRNLEEKREFGIRIVELNYNNQREAWKGTVNIDVTCIAGQYRHMVEMVSKKVSNQAVTDDLDVSDVTYSTQNSDSKKFTIKISFVDNLIPAFIAPYPILEKIDPGDPDIDNGNTGGGTGDEGDNEGDGEDPGDGDTPSTRPPAAPPPQEAMITDTLIRPKIKANREAMLHYLIAPHSAGLTKDEDGLAGQIIEGLIDIEGAVLGSYPITKGNAISQPTIEGLQPNTKYDAFFVLKAAPTTPSAVEHRYFETTDIEPPVLDITVGAQGPDYANIEVYADKNAQISWVILNKSEAKGYINADGTVNKEREAWLKNVIRNGTVSEVMNPESYGTNLTAWNKDFQRYEISNGITQRGINTETFYYLLAIAQTRLSSGELVGDYSKIYVSEQFTAKDTTPPELRNMNTTLGAQSANPDNENPEFAGKLRITFTETLYYRETKDAVAKPLTWTAEDQQNGTGFGILKKQLEDSGLNISSITPLTNKISITEPGDEPGTTVTKTVDAAYGFTLMFRQVYDGDFMDVNLLLCDEEGNLMGDWALIFRDGTYRDLDGDGLVTNRSESRWVFEEMSRT